MRLAHLRWASDRPGWPSHIRVWGGGDGVEIHSHRDIGYVEQIERDDRSSCSTMKVFGIQPQHVHSSVTSIYAITKLNYMALELTS
jgi:hypothetical protein